MDLGTIGLVLFGIGITLRLAVRIVERVAK
jgi:hypothetical protein